MDPIRWQRVKDVFEAARALPADARLRYVQDACEGDQDLRQEIESLLTACEPAASFLEAPAAQMFPSLAISPSLAHRRLGPYEISSQVGRGGMGEVYKAFDTRLNRHVAIKALAVRSAAEAQAIERFAREARATGVLSHPHICALYDVGHEDGVHYLVMEFLDGETLAARLRRGTPPLDQALACASEIASALEHAHRAGIVHRDLKPANIMLTKSGAKLLDFGLAKTVRAVTVGSDRAEADLTAPGTILGTASYMAPEQLEGKDADARTDLFAFGAVLYEMLAGRKAFEAPNDAMLVATIMASQPPALVTVQPKLPAALGYLLSRCFAKDPDDRWQTARDLRAEVDRIRANANVADAAAVAAARPGVRAKIGLAFAAGAIIVALGIGAIGRFGARPVERATWLSILPPADGFDLAPDPAVSPDGRYIAYKAQDRSHRTHIWLKTLDASDAAPIPGTEGAELTSAHFWSPDSRSLGYFAQGKLKRVDINGGGQQVLASAPSPRGGTWTRNGIIIFCPDARSLMHVSAMGGDVSPVAGSPTELRIFPHVLPDGRHYLFWSSNSGGQGRGIYVGALDSPDARRLAPEDSTMAYARGYLFFARQNALFAQPFDVDRRELSGYPRRLADSIGVGYGNPFTYAFSVSEGGIVSSWSGVALPNLQLTWFDRNGQRIAGAGRHPIQAGFTLDRMARRAALEVPNPAARGIDVWVLDLTSGAAAARLTTDGRFSVPVLSPDGSRVAMMERGRGIVVLTIGGSAGPEVIVPGPASKYPLAWSSDGRFLAFSDSTPAGWRLWTTPARVGSQPTLYREAPFALFGLEFSPDGTRVAYTSNESGQPDVYVDSFPTPENRIRVSTEGGVRPKWRRDGRELYYLGLDRRLMVSSVEKTVAGMTFSPPRALFEGPGVHPDTERTQFEPSPDGSRFLFNARIDDPTPRGLTVILNWPALLK
jgi:eukaryotic-like serine/threonine-protein kinase